MEELFFFILDTCFPNTKWARRRARLREFPVYHIEGYPLLFDPIGPTKEERFWKVIRQLDLHQEDDYFQTLQAVNKLSRYEVSDILAFQFQLDYKIHRAKLNLHPQLRELCQRKYLVEQMVLFAICGSIAQGQDYFKAQMKSKGWVPKAFFFQPLLSMARDAYELKTGYDDLRYGDVRRPGWED